MNRSNINDDLTIVRNILHTNMLLCLIIVQVLFVFGIDQTKKKVEIERILKSNQFFFKDKLSDYLDSSRLFSFGNILLDVCRWN